MKYLLDSVILIDHFNGIAPATTYLAEHGAACALSVIARAEVLTGFDGPGASLALGLLDQFPPLPITREIGDLAALLRRSQRWKLPDALQAAVAMHHDLVLVTRNTRDFRTGEGLRVLVPYSV